MGKLRPGHTRTWRLKLKRAPIEALLGTGRHSLDATVKVFRKKKNRLMAEGTTTFTLDIETLGARPTPGTSGYNPFYEKDLWWVTGFAPDPSGQPYFLCKVAGHNVPPTLEDKGRQMWFYLYKCSNGSGHGTGGKLTVAGSGTLETYRTGDGVAAVRIGSYLYLETPVVPGIQKPHLRPGHEAETVFVSFEILK